MAQSAAHAALNTVELLEAILLNLDTRTLLLSQRTCKTWQKVIAASILLQKALFLRPAPQPSPPGDATPNNAAADEAAPDDADPPHAERDDADAATGEAYPQTADDSPIFNPLARGAFQLRKLKPGQPNTKVKSRPKEYTNPWIAGSFRRMYVTQPPAHEVSIHTCHGGACSNDEIVVARGGEGVTIGDILDKLEKLSGGKPYKAEATVRSAWVGENRVDNEAGRLPTWHRSFKLASWIHRRT
ncbi:hypothetical protein AC579_8220 [Pseudocercospora musae]|uniref:F-box domain-containing protein n=1 Tax=Pseudocercospora musae TaxID=113226 RepID=A0A139IVN2_9PEZI|nr:hypothetical protein AC579_8220 [Pseudocercospora musae]